MEAHFGAHTIRCLIFYIDSKYGETFSHWFFQGTGITYHDLLDDSRWLSADYFTDVSERLIELEGGRIEAIRDGGLLISDPRAFTLLQSLMSKFINTQMFYGNIPTLASAVNRFHRPSSKKISSEEVTLIWSYPPNVPIHRGEKLFCLSRIGNFEALRLWRTQKLAKVQETQCLAEGYPSCEYKVTWDSEQTLWSNIKSFFSWKKDVTRRLEELAHIAIEGVPSPNIAHENERLLNPPIKTILHPQWNPSLPGKQIEYKWNSGITINGVVQESLVQRKNLFNILRYLCLNYPAWTPREELILQSWGKYKAISKEDEQTFFTTVSRLKSFFGQEKCILSEGSNYKLEDSVRFSWTECKEDFLSGSPLSETMKVYLKGDVASSSCTVPEYAKNFNVDLQRAYHELNEMVRLGVVERKPEPILWNPTTKAIALPKYSLTGR